MTAYPGAIAGAPWIAGAWYLVLAVVAPFGLPYPPTLVLSGDVAATTRNIPASETLFRLSMDSKVAAVISIFLVRQSTVQKTPTLDTRGLW